MEFREPRSKTRPEDVIHRNWREHCQALGWRLWKTHGNAYQSGFPDLYMAHMDFGSRWVELKTTSGCLTPAQIRVFKEFSLVGVGVYIITSVRDYPLLFKPANYYQFITNKTSNVRAIGDDKRPYNPFDKGSG